MFKLSKITLTIITSAAILASSQNILAAVNQSSSIYATSISWQDEANKSKLLQLAPTWNNETVQAMFDAYQHPERFELTKIDQAHPYNVQFINGLWGPLANPFTKFARPLKVFVMFNESAKADEPSEFYMAPVVMNEQDHQYYVFDKAQTKPISLSQWVDGLKTKHPQYSIIKFNVCNAYGDLPADSCADKDYMQETGDMSRSDVRTLTTHPVISAKRGLHQQWTTIAKNKKLTSSYDSQGTIHDTSVSWHDQTSRYELLNTVTTWPNYQVIQANFEKIRDLRYFQDEEVANFPRRISWLYPDDGCWTRASAVIRDLFGPYHNLVNNYERPSKVFAFGNLCANTPNAPEGYVSWWYHTAPIVRDAETNLTYVLDPSIDPHHPIQMEKWAEAIASQSGPCEYSPSRVDQFNICTGYGSGPYSPCQDAYNNETYSMQTQPEYQHYERERQVDLGRDANQVLGDLPPWHQG